MRILPLTRHLLGQGKNPFAWNESRERGMSTYTGIVDWLGGLPYEVASEEEIAGFCRERGFETVRFEPCPEGGNHVGIFRKSGLSR